MPSYGWYTVVRPPARRVAIILPAPEANPSQAKALPRIGIEEPTPYRNAQVSLYPRVSEFGKRFAVSHASVDPPGADSAEDARSVTRSRNGLDQLECVQRTNETT